MDKAVKFAIIVGILLAGFGVFYHYVIYLPDVEQRRVERERAERDAAARRAEAEKQEVERRKSEREIAYFSCLSDAAKGYRAQWAAECKGQARARSAELKNCLADPNMRKQFCQSLYGDGDPGPNCSLPSSLAESINKHHDKAKQQCLAEAKLF